MTVRVLLVEDTDHVREMLRHLMELQGFEVVGEAPSASDALAMIGETAPDVVIMDYKMPGMNGVEATRRIRAQRPEQAVILYSAYTNEEIERGARDAGVVAVVPKTSGFETLAHEIAVVAFGMRRDGDG